MNDIDENTKKSIDIVSNPESVISPIRLFLFIGGLWPISGALPPPTMLECE